jgi:hypothetical protein
LPEKAWNYFPNRLELFPTALLNVVIKQQETFFGEMTMSTHAVIANVNPDGRCQAVYLHYDGYPEYLFANDRWHCWQVP